MVLMIWMFMIYKIINYDFYYKKNGNLKLKLQLILIDDKNFKLK